MKTCKDCRRTLPFSEFYRNSSMTDGHLSWCKPCNHKRYGPGKAQRQRRLLAYIQQIKMERGCTDCGYRKHPAALEFDHLPEFTKTYRIGTMAAGNTRAKIDAEIAKCEVVCANCHAVRTADRRRSRHG